MAIQTEWKIRKPEYKCHRSGRLLAAGEAYVTCLYEEDIDGNPALVRRDFAADQWPGEADTGLFSHWKAKVPADLKKKAVLDLPLLENLFFRLSEEKDPQKIGFCYLIALLLMRKRVLKFEDSYAEGGAGFMVLRHVQEKRNYTIHDPKLSAENIEALRGELEQLLQSDLE